jgi:cytochrome c2
MLSQFSSMLVALLLVIAGVTILVMIEMTGKKGEGQQEKKKRIRRLFGYLLFFLFAVVVALLLNNAGGFDYQGMMSVWEAVHIVLALLLLALIFIKLFLIKLHVQSSFRLILIGTSVFGFIFVLIGVTIGYYIFTPSGFRSAAEVETRWTPRSIASDQNLMEKRCSKCHSLERIFLRSKDRKDWQQTVQRMAELDYPYISNVDVERITDYLIDQQQRREKSTDGRKTGKNLVSRKCGICHDLARVFGANKTMPEWEETIDNMIELLGVSSFLSPQEKIDIVMFLSSRQGSKIQSKPSSKAKRVEALVARKCSAGCHALDRVLRVEKNQQQWRATVENMEAMTGDPTFLSKQEKDIIIDWLLHRKQLLSQEKMVDLESPEDVHTLISGKCISCHDSEKLFQGRIREGGHSSRETK